MHAFATHVLLVSLWLRSYGLALTSVGLQGPCWDVKGPRRLLSPPPSVEESISGRGSLPSMICFRKIRRPFQHSGSLLTCSSPHSHELRPSYILGSPHKRIPHRNLDPNNGGYRLDENHDAILRFDHRKVRHCEHAIQVAALIMKKTQVCSRKTEMFEE